MPKLIETIRMACSPAQEADLEMRLYRMLTLAAALLSFLVIIPTNLVQNTSPYVNLAVLIFGCAAALLYLASHRSRIFPKLFFLLMLLTLNVTWFLNGGSQGSVGFYFFSAVTYPLIFFRGRARWSLLLLFIVDGVLLLTTDFRFPEYIIPLASPTDRLIDLTTGFITSSLASGLMLWGVLTSHDREHLRKNELNRQLIEVLAQNRRRAIELEKSLAEIRTLRGLLPICAWCKKIRDDEGLWTRMEEYICTRTDAEFTHSLCPDCFHEQCEKEARQTAAGAFMGIQGELFQAATSEDDTP